MKKTIFTCDKCGKEHEVTASSPDTYEIAVCARSSREVRGYGFSNNIMPIKSQEWCLACYRGLRADLHPPKDTKEESAVKPPSFEERLSGLLDELGYVRD